jgi:NagD protein
MANDQASQANNEAGKTIESYLIDMNGVLVQDEQLIPGADQFIAWLKATGRRFLVLTSDSVYTQRDLAARLARSGLDVPAEAIWTSAVATAQFLAEQRPDGSAYALGEAGLTAALHEVGYILSERGPDYVVLGETRAYSLERLTLAIRLIAGGARFIATNPEPTGLSQQGLQPGTGAVAALISRATGIQPYIVGKPNPFMMRSALRAIDAHSASTVLIGDRMDTDIVAGMEAGMQTILVLSGVDQRETLDRYPYMPSRIVDSVADLVDTADKVSDPASGSSRRRRGAARKTDQDRIQP